MDREIQHYETSLHVLHGLAHQATSMLPLFAICLTEVRSWCPPPHTHILLWSLQKEKDATTLQTSQNAGNLQTYEERHHWAPLSCITPTSDQKPTEKSTTLVCSSKTSEKPWNSSPTSGFKSHHISLQFKHKGAEWTVAVLDFLHGFPECKCLTFKQGIHYHHCVATPQVELEKYQNKRFYMFPFNIYMLYFLTQLFFFILI